MIFGLDNGVTSTYLHLDEFKSLLKLILLRLQGALDHFLGPLSEAQKLNIILKLKEEVTECLEGVHCRAAETVSTFFLPKHVLDLLQLVRESLVLETAFSLKYSGVHNTNAIFVVGSNSGFGVRIRSKTDPYSLKWIEQNFSKIYQALTNKFEQCFRPFALLHLLEERLRTLIADRYAGEKKSPGYNRGDCNYIMNVLNPFLFSHSEGYQGDAFYFKTKENEDNLLFISDLNWKNIKFRLLEHLEEVQCFSASVLTEMPIETIDDAIYCSQIIPHEGEIWQKLLSSLPNLLLNSNHSEIEHFLLNADPTLIQGILLEQGVFTIRDFKLLVQHLPFELLVRWFKTQANINQYLLESSLDLRVSEFLIQNFLSHSPACKSEWIFSGLLALCKKLSEDQKRTLFAGMSAPPPFLDSPPIMHTPRDTSVASLSEALIACIGFPVDPRASGVNEDRLITIDPVVQNGWERLFFSMNAHASYDFASYLLDWLEPLFAQQQTQGFNMTNMAAVYLFQYLVEALSFLHRKEQMGDAQRLLRLIKNTYDLLPLAQISKSLPDIMQLWKLFVTPSDSFETPQFYSLFSDFFAHVFLTIPKETLSSLITGIETDSPHHGDLFINLIYASTDCKRVAYLKSLLEFLNKVENRTDGSHYSLVPNVLKTSADNLVHQIWQLLVTEIDKKNFQAADVFFDFLTHFIESTSPKTFEAFWRGAPTHPNPLCLRAEQSVTKASFDQHKLVTYMILSSLSSEHQTIHKKNAQLLSLIIQKVYTLAHAYSLSSKHQQSIQYLHDVICYTRALYSDSRYSALFHRDPMILPPALKEYQTAIEQNYWKAVDTLFQIQPSHLPAAIKMELSTKRAHLYLWDKHRITHQDPSFMERYSMIFSEGGRLLSCCI